MGMIWLDLDGRLVALLLVALMAVALEAGFRLGRRHAPRIGEPARSQVAAIQGATLALLALLLGFSFSLALERHDNRSHALVAEANTLGTAWLRSGLLPEALRASVQADLAAYIRQRIETTGLPLTEHDAHADRQRREAAMQAALWQGARAASTPRPDLSPPVAALYVQSINEALDAHAVHEAALARHVPGVVMMLLLAGFVLAGGIVGYAAGIHGHRGLVSTGLMLGLITLLVYLIVDLDRPRRGLVTVDAAPLQALESALPPRD